MSEPAKVRVVRCPKCENLLPELTDYSVYQCGGCGAVLSAEKGNGDVVALSEKYDEERIRGFSEKLYEKSKNIEVSELSRMRIGHVPEDDVESNGSFSNRAERRTLLHDGIENYRAGLMTTANKWIVDGGAAIDDNISGISHTKMDRSFEEMKSQMGNGKGLQTSGEQLHWRLRGISEMDGFPRPPRNDPVSTSYSTSKYLEEGPSNYQGSYGFREPLKNRIDFDAADNIGSLEDNQAEILRKLDELRDQLTRSCDVVDKPKDNFPLDRRMVPPDHYGYSEKWFPDGYSAIKGGPVPYSFPDHHVAKPSYVNHYTETSPFMNGHGFYPPAHTSGHIQEVEDSLRSQFLRRGPYQAPGRFQQKPSHTRFSGTYVDSNMVPMDSYEPYRPTISHHHPLCSCFHCYQFELQRQVPPNAYGSKQFSDLTNDPAFYHHEYQNTVGLRDYSENYNRPTSSKSNNSISHTRWPSDLKSEASSFVRNRPSRILVTTGRHRCQPVAGGAPFLACQNCHELLQLPKKVFLNGKLQKMRCGACSILIQLTVDSKKLNVSVHAEANITNAKFNMSHSDFMNEGSSRTRGHPNRDSVNFASNDFDHSGYDFQSMDRALGSMSTGLGSSIKSADIRSPHSTFSSSDDKEHSLDNLTAMRNNSSSPKLLAERIASPPPAGSPLQEYFDYSNKYNVANRNGVGNISGRSELDKMMPMKTISRQNSIKDASATEIEISSNEYSNTGTSIDSGEASREENQLRANKAAQSFFAGIIKKSFRDSDTASNNADQEEKANVTVNGNLISVRQLKRASKLAGPILAGHYWYDFRAGFWGVMGGPCRGIIPPFIEEFNYPMPENCAGGGTGVFVNGRDLHPKDLNLLASRGLPTDSNRSFILEISGRILDEDTGEELESLGKLAPTIERLKRGFGMKNPKAAV